MAHSPSQEGFISNRSFCEQVVSPSPSLHPTLRRLTTTFPILFDQCVDSFTSLSNLTGEDEGDKAKSVMSLPIGNLYYYEANVEYTTSMILQVILRPWLFILSKVSTRDLPLSRHVLH